MTTRQDKIPQNRSRYLLAMTLGLNMAVGMAVFSYVGYYIDQKRGGGQLFTLLGMFAGIFYCGYEVWKIIRQDNERSATSSK